MALLDRVKERIETDMSDAELSLMITEIQAEIVRRHGAIAEETFQAEGDRDLWGQGRLLTLVRPIDTAQPLAVVEVDAADEETTLAADDYRVLHGGRTLERLRTGTNGRREWQSLVRVTYTPESDQAQRDEVTIKLVELDLSYRGLVKSERAGDYASAGAMSPAAYTDERDALLQQLAPRRGLQVA